MRTYSLDDLAQLVDHTNLHPDATRADLERLCDEARLHHFKTVCVNSAQSAFCRGLLEGTDVHVGAAIGFPLGQTSIATKAFETRDALSNGANEIDYVVNLTEVKAGNWDYVRDEMRAIIDACNEAGATSKVIFENCLLTQDEKIRLCEIASEVQPTFVKTSTGFSTGGATVEDVRLMREHVDERVKVKAAGGIRSADDLLAMVHAGAERIGCSASIAIIEEIAGRMRESGTDAIEV